MKKLGLALSGGGTRGIAHAGFLKALDEHEIKVHSIVGCSMGSIVGAAYCLGRAPEEMRDMFYNFKHNDIVDIDLMPIRNLSIVKGEKVYKIVRNFFKHAKFEDCKIPFACTAVDLVSCEEVVFTEGDIQQAVLASSAIPSVFRPVRIGKQILIDGGIINRIPVNIAKSFGAEVVIAVDAVEFNTESVEINNIFQLIARTLEVADYQQTKNQLKQNKADLLLIPSMPGVSLYKVKNMQEAYESGYKVAVDNIKKIKKLINK